MTIELGKDEALVLFDWITRRIEGRRPYTVEHAAEQHVLWGIECDLEKALVEPFRRDYAELVDVARERIVERCGEIEPG